MALHISKRKVFIAVLRMAFEQCVSAAQRAALPEAKNGPSGQCRDKQAPVHMREVLELAR